MQWTKGFGVKDKRSPNNVPPDADTIFRIASITKVFVVSYNFIKWLILILNLYFVHIIASNAHAIIMHNMFL